jgi:hypothetical protein
VRTPVSVKEEMPMPGIPRGSSSRTRPPPRTEYYYYPDAALTGIAQDTPTAGTSSAWTSRP